jgi:hypothetical protein
LARSGVVEEKEGEDMEGGRSNGCNMVFGWSGYIVANMSSICEAGASRYEGVKYTNKNKGI